MATIIPYTYGVLALLWVIILISYLRYWKIFPAQNRSIRILLLTLAMVSLSPLTESIYRLLASTSQPEFQLLPLLTGFFSAIAVLVIIILRVLPALRREAEGNPLETKAAEKESKAAKFHISPELQVMLEHTPSLSYFKNSRSRYVAVSQRFADFLGRSIDDILGKTDYELLPNDIAAELHKLDREVYRSGRAIESMESALKRGDGQMRWLSSRKHAFRSEHGNILGIISISDDLTEQKLNERALLMNQYAMNSAKEGMFWIDRESKFIYVNETACQILGYSQEELLSMRMPDVLMNITEELLETIWEQIQNHQNTTFEATHLRKNGTEFPIEISANYLEHENKEYCCLFTSSIGKQKDAEQQLQLADKLIETTSEGILVSDPEGFVTSVNSAFTANSGYEPNDIIGEQVNVLYSGHHEQKFYQELWESLYHYGRWQGEIWNQHKNGSLYPSSLQISAIYDSNGYLINYISIYSDTSLQQEHQRRLHKLGYYDGLTGLPSHPLLNDRLLTSLSHAQREEHQVALLYIDLDNLKKVNNAAGHATGDQLIQTIAERLQTCLREVDTLARISSDEFVVILPELQQLDEVKRSADKMLDVISSPITLAEQEFKISASIGISLYPDDATDSDQLTQQAKHALQHAKDNGCNRYQIYREASQNPDSSPEESAENQTKINSTDQS
ncbi:MAG: PAS domain S-box protein [Gammaproteobacteria bacterium]|nr:PAS domain S-box protein [Gammaproteobacteria bacterium]